MELNLQELKGLILSPGNIFWKQKSGRLIPLCTKANFLNLNLLQKLSSAERELLIVNQVDSHIQHEFTQNFYHHNEELLVKNKIYWRHKLFSLFATLMSDDEFSQFELNQIAWKVFSKVELEKARQLLDQDILLFKRSMDIATSYTLCAFMLGYYSDLFLEKIYTETFLDLMELNLSTPLSFLKEKLEQIRGQESWQEEDIALVKELYGLEQKKSLVLGERLNGSGLQQINRSEMTDLEILLIALYDHYAFTSNSGINIFNEIGKSFFKCDEKILSSIKKCLYRESEALPKASA